MVVMTMLMMLTKMVREVDTIWRKADGEVGDGDAGKDGERSGAVGRGVRTARSAPCLDSPLPHHQIDWPPQKPPTWARYNITVMRSPFHWAYHQFKTFCPYIFKYQEIKVEHFYHFEVFPAAWWYSLECELRVGDCQRELRVCDIAVAIWRRCGVGQSVIVRKYCGVVWCEYKGMVCT